MTTLTVPTPREEDAHPRPLPWRRMAWVTWRHHRIALGGVAVFLGALAVWLWIVGLQLHHAYAAAIACHPAGSTACSEMILNFRVTGGILKGGFVLQPVPALIGAFVGPLVLAREIETGTFRYAWTQGFGRWRWTLAKLVMLGVALAAIAGAFSVLASWYYEPYLATGRLYNATSALPHWLFDLRGSRSPLGRLPRSRSAHSPACSFAGSSLRSPPLSLATAFSPSLSATSCAPTTSRPATSGGSRGSRAGGCSRCRCCSSQRPSGWPTVVRLETQSEPSDGIGCVRHGRGRCPQVPCRHFLVSVADRFIRTGSPTTPKGGYAVRRKSLTLLCLVPVMAISVSLASCNLSAPNGPPGPTGTLTGTLQAVGGPPDAGPRALSGEVTLHESNGRGDVITVGANGRFSLPVAVGKYTVSGRSPQYGGGTAECHAPGPVTVTKGVTSTAEVDCQVE